MGIRFPGVSQIFRNPGGGGMKANDNKELKEWQLSLIVWAVGTIIWAIIYMFLK